MPLISGLLFFINFSPLTLCFSDEIYKQINERQPRIAIDINSLLWIIFFELSYTASEDSQIESGVNLKALKKNNWFLDPVSYI